ncbi:MAG: hypothetical protein J1G06_08710, partial [Oscillospiraceae bacterium]|nr:hypothetical protein [Oscillospiraceae bacterium]
MKYKKPKIYVSVISTILCIAAIVACASNPKSSDFDISYDNLKMSDEALAEFYTRMVGAIMADIDYADSERIVFHYGNAVFVYNHKTAAMEKSFDLDNLNCAYFQQGDYGAHIIVSDDGKEALLVNYGSNDDIKDFKNYIINLENGNAKETNKTELSNPFSSLFETYTTVPDSNGWTSVRCAGENDNVWYLTCESSYIGDMKLCLYKLGETVWEDYIFENKVDAKQDIFNPQDIYDLADVQLIVGQNSYSILDKSNLTEIEEMFSNAEEIKFGTGCPFKAVLKMTRTDGTEGVVILASDTCAVYKSNDVYYDYSDGDNSRLLSMFGTDIDTLTKPLNIDYAVYDKNGDEISLKPFTDEEVAAARAVIEEYFRAGNAKDRQAQLATLTQWHHAPNVLLA